MSCDAIPTLIFAVPTSFRDHSKSVADFVDITFMALVKAPKSDGLNTPFVTDPRYDDA